MVKHTANDVAKAAGVSVAAVSRAFHEDSSLSAEKRARILATARQLNYRTPSAKALARLSTRTVTLVAADLENPFYPAAAAALSEAIHASGRRLILHAVPPGETVDTVMEQVLAYRSEAAIVTSALMSSRLARECRRRNMPVILFNRVQPDARMTAVTCDNYGGGRLVAQRLVQAARRRIALIGGRTDTSTHLERRRGFGDALAEAGLVLQAERNGGFRYDQAFAAARDLLDGPGRPDALFCINDIMALAALDAAREIGLRLPDDLAIIGFDDIAMAAWHPYQLTTVRQPLRHMARDTVDLIETQLADPDAGGAIRIAPVSLIPRASG